jgi:hypothetical protein
MQIATLERGKKSVVRSFMVGRIRVAFTLSARTRKIPKSSSIAHCVTIFK